VGYQFEDAFLIVDLIEKDSKIFFGD